MCSLQNDTTSSSSNDSPARTTIHATTLSPNTGSGLPTTAHSDTAESLYITSSTSRGHILRPAEFTISFNRSTNAEESFFFLSSHIAGFQPSIDQRLCRSLRVIVVLLHHVRTLDHDLAHLPTGKRFIVITPDLDLHILYWGTY